MAKVIIIDFQRKPRPVGPPAEVRVARDDVLSEFEQSGFRLSKEHVFAVSVLSRLHTRADRRQVKPARSLEGNQAFAHAAAAAAGTPANDSVGSADLNAISHCH
jgi:hypothetical protein